MTVLPRFALPWWEQVADQWDALRQRIGFAAPFDALPAWMAPGVALGALLGLALAAGIALLSLGTLLTALLMAHLLLERVFGITIAVTA